MGQGPDGKLLVRMRDEQNKWRLENILVTFQQAEFDLKRENRN